MGVVRDDFFAGLMIQALLKTRLKTARRRLRFPGAAGRIPEIHEIRASRIFGDYFKLVLRAENVSCLVEKKSNFPTPFPPFISFFEGMPVISDDKAKSTVSAPAGFFVEITHERKNTETLMHIFQKFVNTAQK